MKFLISVVYVAVIGILAHYIGESLPRCWFNEEKFPYKPMNFEKNGKIYDRIGIKKWKEKLPDMSRVMRDMLPKKISYGATGESVGALIKETCVAECMHCGLSVLSFGIYFIWKNYIGILLVAVFIVLNTPFILIQRYNRPHLIKLKKRLLKREEKANRALADTVL